jgi:hypothetical protein
MYCTVLQVLTDLMHSCLSDWSRNSKFLLIFLVSLSVIFFQKRDSFTSNAVPFSLYESFAFTSKESVSLLIRQVSQICIKATIGFVMSLSIRLSAWNSLVSTETDLHEI